MALKYEDLLKQLDIVAKNHAADPALYPVYACVETGKYKPFTVATIRKAKRLGHRVEGRGSFYYVYPLEPK